MQNFRTLLLISIISILGGRNAHAQLTLTAADFSAPVAGTTDTLLFADSTSVLPMLSRGAAATWDMNHAVADAPFGVYVYYKHNGFPDTMLFPQARFTDEDINGYYILPFLQLPFITQHKSFSAAGYREYGAHIYRQAYHLPNFSFADDSIIFPEQTVRHSSPYMVLRFPATYKSSWSSVYRDSVSFLMNLQAFGYNYTPCYTMEYKTETDSVTGWGYMRVKAINGLPGNYMNVLQVRRKFVEIDSTFVGGSASSLLMLVGSYGSQGQRTVRCYEDYYRPGESRPLASIMYTDSTYTTPLTVCTLSQNMNTDLTFVSDRVNATAISIYPNPLASRSLMVDLADALGNWSYKLLNNAGSIVASGTISNGTDRNHASIVLPAGVASGVYYLSMQNSDGQIAVRSLEIVK